jgi:UDP-glucose 4-epimerase
VRILITGALGHIGSSLIHGMRPGEFEEVLMLDNLSSERYCSLFNLPAGVPFHFVEGDVCTTDLAPLLQDIDCVVHLAAITNAAGSFDMQAQVEHVNFEGTRRVAEACAEAGAKLLFLSTTSVYGTQAETVDENCTAAELAPQSPYATSKLRAEQLLAELAATRGLRYFIGRFGTICGISIGMRFHTAVNKFCWQASLGQPLTVWRTAEDQVRPYLALSDAVGAIRFVLKTGLFDNRVYNVLTDNASVRQIVDMLRREIGDVSVQYVDTRIMNQLSYEVAAERIRQAGFRFEGSLATSIAQTVSLIRGMSAARPRVNA